MIYIQNMTVSNVNPKEGDIIYFWSNDAQKEKYAINLEPRRIHKNKPTFNGVLTTTQRIDNIYPLDYKLPDGTMQKSTKVTCDQPQAISKKIAGGIKGKVSNDDLKEIRKRVAESLGFDYSGTTT